MNRAFRFVVAMCLAMTVGACAQTVAVTPEQVIRPVMAKMLAAAEAHDTDAFMAPMVHEPSLVFAINGEVIRGWDALHAQQLKWWGNGKSDWKYKQRGAAGFTALGPDVEIVTWPLGATGTLPDGKTVTSAFVVTYVWQHLPQGWRIVYGHESWAKLPG